MKKHLLAALAVSIAVPAWGQVPYSPNAAPDEFSLTKHSDVHAVVEYHNSAARSSGKFPQTLTDTDLTVEIRVHVSEGPETLEVIPPDGWVAMPPFLDVLDGETGTVELRRGEYLGF